MSATNKPLPVLNQEKPLKKEQVSQFQKEGHILLPGLLTPEEVAVYEPVIVQAAERYNTERRKLEDRDTYGRAFLQIMNLWRQDERVKEFVLARRFARTAADLLGVENVRLYHDQALFKEAGGGPTPWHIDQYYWPLDSSNTVTMWMPLVDIEEEMGMLTFASGSHLEKFSSEFEISDSSDKEIKDYIKEKGFPFSRATTMKAGDATFHYGYTLHGAPGNNSRKMREVITIIYFADGARITEPKNEGQVNDRERWLANKPIGEKAASDLNPLLL